MDPGTLAFRVGLLADVEGRDGGPVSLEVAAPGEGLARWADAGVPRACPFPTLPAEQLPGLPAGPTKLAPQPPHFLAALAAASQTAARDDVRFALTRIMLAGKRGEVVATDGRQLLLQGGFALPWAEDVLVPALPVFGGKELGAGGPAAVGRTAEHVVVQAGPWAFHLPIDAAARYPDVRAVVPRTPTGGASRLHLHEDDVPSLLRALPRLPGGSDSPAPVTLDLGEVVVLRSRGEGDGPPAELALSRSHASGPPAAVVTDRLYLLRAARLGFREVEVPGADRPLVCRDASRTYLWMPLGRDGAIPPSADALRVASADADPVPQRPKPQPVKRRPDMPAPADNGPEPRGGAPRPGPATPETPDGLPDPVAEAEALRDLLQQAQARVGRLLAALRLQRRQGRALQAAVASLRQLRLGP
jgi:hypothetical protein